MGGTTKIKIQDDEKGDNGSRVIDGRLRTSAEITDPITDGRLDTSTVIIAPVNEFGQAGVTVTPHEHANLHEGLVFTASHINLFLAGESTQEYLLRAPEGSVPHSFFVASAGGDAVISLAEVTIEDDPGTEITPINRNRMSSKVTLVQFFHTPGETIVVQQLGSTLIFGGQKNRAFGGSVDSVAEIIFAENTDYRFSIANNSDSTIAVQFSLTFYDTSAVEPPPPEEPPVEG